jgi:hypothetical protein
MKLQRALVRILCGVGLTIYTLAFGEAFVRHADPQVLLSRYVTGTPWGVRGNIPNARYWHSTPEVRVEFRINGQGMRADRDYRLDKPAGTCRIALFGDSFFIGYELSLEDTFAFRLEEHLKADRYNVEVLNFSVSGFGTAEMIRTYENFGRSFSPDVIVFQWHSTDLDDNVRANLFEFKDGRLESTGNTYLPAIKIQDALMKFDLYRLVADNSHLYSIVRERTAKFVQHMLVEMKKPGQKSPTSKVATRDADKESEEASTPYPVALSVALLQHARQMTHKEGRDFFVVEIPDRLKRTSFRSSLDTIPKLAPDLTIISPIAAFERLASPDIKLYFERGHSHLTPIAIHALVEVAARQLKQSARLGNCRNTQ